MREPWFANYQYKEALFPRLCFRQAYDQLIRSSPSRGHKDYLELLQLAKMYGEQQIAAGLELLREQKIIPLPQAVKELLDLPIKIPAVKVTLPALAIYDQLLSYKKNMEVAL